MFLSVSTYIIYIFKVSAMDALVWGSKKDAVKRDIRCDVQISESQRIFECNRHYSHLVIMIVTQGFIFS